MSILDEYVLNAPSNQNVLDIFKGEWSSELPGKFGLVTQPGTAKLFEDSRIVWAEEVLGKFADCKILELGPLEGGHSYMFQNAGAREVISIEANTRAFLKCLCIKEIFKLDRVQFLLGDFTSFLRESGLKHDVVIASGVLYHMDKPVELLELISAASEKVFIWTHYYDHGIISSNPNLVHKFAPLQPVEHLGVTYEYSIQSYKDALGWAGFCGGNQSTSKWLTRDSLMWALREFGFTKIEVSFDDPNHPNGPALALCAMK